MRNDRTEGKAMTAGEMNREKVVKLLKLFPEIDSEISVRRGILNDLERYYDTSGAINYDGMPHGINHISNPTEKTALNVPDFVRKEIEKYTAEIAELQKVKVEILKEVSRLSLKQKNIVFGFYFHSMKWEKVASRTHYSERQCKNIRDAALDRLLCLFRKNTTLTRYEIKE